VRRLKMPEFGARCAEKQTSKQRFKTTRSVF